MKTNAAVDFKQNETIQWESKAENFPLLAPGVRSSIFLKWILTVVIFGGFLTGYAISNGGVNPWFCGACIIIALLIIFSPVLERRNVLKCRYLITDQRILLSIGNKTPYYIDLAKLDSCKVITDRSGKKSMIFGSCLFNSKEKQLRWQTGHPKTDLQANNTDGSVIGLIFYHPEKLDAAVSLLKLLGKKVEE